MTDSIIPCPDRIRKINGSFAFIEHRFLRDGFFASLDHHELLLYLFLIIVGDRNGVSFYGYDKICTLLRTSLDGAKVVTQRVLKRHTICGNLT